MISPSAFWQTCQSPLGTVSSGRPTMTCSALGVVLIGSILTTLLHPVARPRSRAPPIAKSPAQVQVRVPVSASFAVQVFVVPGAV